MEGRIKALSKNSAATVKPDSGEATEIEPAKVAEGGQLTGPAMTPVSSRSSESDKGNI